MAEPKTTRTKASVAAFLASVPDARRRADAVVVKRMMEKVSGEKAEMWGPSIVGFGAYTYNYSNGKALEWPIIGFSPRKQNLVLYIMTAELQKDTTLMAALGKHKTGKSCLYLNSLADVDLQVLETLVRKTVAYMRERSARGPLGPERRKS
jgi:Domain of unknown function (DU1801)